MVASVVRGDEVEDEEEEEEEPAFILCLTPDPDIDATRLFDQCHQRLVVRADCFYIHAVCNRSLCCRCSGTVPLLMTVECSLKTPPNLPPTLKHPQVCFRTVETVASMN